MHSVNIDAQFDGGNIELVCVDNPDNIRLKIRRDIHADYRQWFYFRAMHVKNKHCRFSLVNAHESTYPEAWANGTIVASYDRKSWFRVSTDYHGGALAFSISPEKDVVYVALNPPYSYERHQSLVCEALQRPGCSLHESGTTIAGRPVEVLKIGITSSEKKSIWIIARQHPAETVAEWFMEGLIHQLLAPASAVSRALLEQATFYLVPNMNPDGGIDGNLRTNGAGLDLNRAWLSPQSDSAPEVCFVKGLMEKTGVDLFFDIHGDEEIPYVFAAGCEGNPNYSERLAKLDRDFRARFRDANPDFCIDNGYPPDEPGEADLSIACNQVGNAFDCLSLTIEIPFKDNKYLSDDVNGWNCDRSQILGASVLTPIYNLIGELR